MSKFKYLYTLLTIIAVAAGFTAFSVSKNVSIATWYFTGSNKLIGLTGCSLSETQIKDINNWISVLPEGWVLKDAYYLRGIVFDEEDIELSAALSILWAKYSDPHTLPPHHGSFNTTMSTITILRGGDNCD